MTTQTAEPLAEQAEEERQITLDLSEVKNADDFYWDDGRYVVWVGGRGCGKTVTATAKVIRYVEENPGARGLIIAPNYPMLKGGTLVTFFEWFPPELIAEYNRSQDEQYIRTTNGCKIWLRNAANPEGYRSMEPAFIWLDEAARMTPEVQVVLAGSMRQKGYRQQLWATTSPKGKNWVWQKFRAPSTRIEGTSFYHSTTFDNPKADPAWVADITAQYAVNDAWYRQEIMGEFVTFEGLVYPMFSYQTHVSQPPTKFEKVFAGADFGTSAATSMHLYGNEPSGHQWSFREYYRRKADPREWLALLAEWDHEFPGLNVWCDPRAKYEIETLRARGIRAKGAKTGPGVWEGGVRFVGTRLQPDGTGRPGLMFSPECANQIAEIQSYCWSERASGMELLLSEKVKTGQDDHACDDCRYAITGEATGHVEEGSLNLRFLAT